MKLAWRRRPAGQPQRKIAGLCRPEAQKERAAKEKAEREKAEKERLAKAEAEKRRKEEEARLAKLREQNLERMMASWQARGELFHLSDVPAAELRTLYACAEAVVCPSVAEGFDMPAVEAMRCGAVVAASDIAVHREILGDAVTYFNPYSPDDLCDLLVRLLSSTDECEALRRSALVRAGRYGRQTVRDQWRELLESCRRPPGENVDAG